MRFLGISGQSSTPLDSVTVSPPTRCENIPSLTTGGHFDELLAGRIEGIVAAARPLVDLDRTTDCGPYLARWKIILQTAGTMGKGGPIARGPLQGLGYFRTESKSTKQIAWN